MMDDEGEEGDDEDTEEEYEDDYGNDYRKNFYSKAPKQPKNSDYEIIYD